jgi:HlyD family secretion protein
VYAGETLASLDVAALEASRAEAEANVAAQQAKLDSLNAGPRQTDIAVKQSAVSLAKQAEAASYAALPSSLSDAYAKAVNAVHSGTDSLFSSPNSANPVLAFSTSNASAGNAAASGREAANAELDAWNTELSVLPASASTAELDTALDAAIAHLTIVRSFEDSLITALNSAIATYSFSSSAVVAAQSAVNGSRTAVNGLVASLTAAQQGIVSESLAIDAANAGLQQLLSGASPQDIAAQSAAVDAAKASVRGIDAQIAENVITAPFSGTVGSVSIKSGEIAAPNAPAITILPDSSLEVSVYVSQIDVTKIAKGDTADVTLDAYGAGTAFPAHVAQVDTAPSMQNGVSAYEVKLSFDTPEASIQTGMTANATIHPQAQ